MGTTLRAELSEKNPYWIEKHRYYELKHFCLQYPIWKKAYAALDGTNTKTMNLAMRVITNNIDDPTSRYAIARAYYADRMNMLERVANFTNPELAKYLLKGITEGWSYDILKATLSIPCGDDESLWHFTVIFNENEYLHKRLVTVMDNFDDGENPAVQSMLVTNENNRTATFEYHMDKDVKVDVKLSVYYCKECRIITAEW